MLKSLQLIGELHCDANSLRVHCSGVMDLLRKVLEGWGSSGREPGDVFPGTAVTETCRVKNRSSERDLSLRDPRVTDTVCSLYE